MAVNHKKAPEKGKTIVNQLIIKAPNRQTSDAAAWRSALKSADTGRIRALYDLYDDLYLDGMLFDAVDKRISAVTNAELTFQNIHGEEIDEIAELIDTSAFEELVTTIMKVRFWGRSGVEFDFSNGFDIHELPVKHIDLDQRLILRNETDTTGIGYEKDDHLLILGKPRNFGLFLRTAPLIIYKRGGFGDYAQWLELFGMPQRIGKYSSHDPESRKILEDAMERMGAAPWLVIPSETEVETIQANGGGNGAAYNDFRIACNEEMLITVLGQTLTTIQGERGARSLGEVHKQVEEGKNKSDMRFVQRILNSRVLPLLEARGFPVNGGKFIFPKAAEPLTVSDIVQLSGIMDIPVKHLHDKYSIPMPKPGDQIAGHTRDDIEDAKIVDDDPDPNDDDDKGSTSVGDKSKKTKKSVRNFDIIRQLRDFFVQAPVKGAIQSFTTNLRDAITGSVTLADGEVTVSINVTKLFNQALKELYGDAVKSPVREPQLIEPHLFEITNKPLQTGIGKAFAAAGFEFGKKNQQFIDEFKYNTSVFAAFKNHQQTGEIIGLLHDADGNLRSFNEFKKLASRVSKDYNKNWLRTEYNTAVRAARSAVNFRKMQDTQRMYPNLEYIESSAREKRSLHLDWVGIIRPIGDIWWDTHMPPSDWNCQCGVKQTDKPVTPIFKGGNGNPIFANNPGKTASFINMKEHPYIKKVCPYVNDCDRKNLNLADHPYKPACEICLFARRYHENQKRIEENRLEYERLKNLKDENGHLIYNDVKFNPKTGGLHAIHREHHFDKAIGAFGIKRGEYEKLAAEVLFQHGRKVILESEKGIHSVRRVDGTLEDILFEIKGVEGRGQSTIQNRFKEANAQGANTVVLYFHKRDIFSRIRLRAGWYNYQRSIRDHNERGVGESKVNNITSVYYIIENELFTLKEGKGQR
jgi:phage gp29-like protein